VAGECGLANAAGSGDEDILDASSRVVAGVEGAGERLQLAVSMREFAREVDVLEDARVGNHVST
jgi:hypothetical protein